MNIIEYLIQKNKKKIVSSIYQNTIYNGKTLCEHLGVKSLCKKPGRDFSYLLSEMIEDLPRFNYRRFMRDINLYKSHKNQYLMYGCKLIKIKDLFDLIEKYKDNEYFPVSVSSPSFFCRKYSILMLNKKTEETVIKYYTIDEYNEMFGDILHSNYIEILEKEQLKKYYGLINTFY